MNRNALAAAMAGVFGLLASAWPGPVGLPQANAAVPEQQSLAPDVVRDLQRSLNQKGYGAGPVDGVLGSSTRTALERFQRDNSLPGAGQIDRRTLAALGITGVTAQAEPEPIIAPPGQTMAPKMVQDVQSELQRLGYDVGRVDGVWGKRTQQALMEFQRDRNLVASGRIDGQTLAALEAGGVTQTGELPEGPAGQRR